MGREIFDLKAAPVAQRGGSFNEGNLPKAYIHIPHVTVVLIIWVHKNKENYLQDFQYCPRKQSAVFLGDFPGCVNVVSVTKAYTHCG